VHVRVPVLLLRLVIHRPHANSLNAGAQAGLVALNIVGEPLPAQAPGGGVPSVVLSEPVSCGADGVPVVEADADAGLDPATAQLLRQLGEAKAAAVQREDFDEAKRLRDALSAARAVAQRRQALEARKADAIAVEDYDAAKALKADIAALDAQGGAAAAAASARAAHAPSSRRVTIPEAPPVSPHRVEAPRRSLEQVSPAAAPRQGRPSVSATAMHTHLPWDERPAVSKATAAAAGGEGGEGEESIWEEEAPSPSAPPKAAPSYPAVGVSSSARLPHSRHAADDPVGAAPGAPPAASHDPVAEGFSAELPLAEPLSAADAKDHGPLGSHVGEYTVMALCSKNWALRDAGLTRLEACLAQQQPLGGPDGAQPLGADAVRGLSRCVARALRDKVATVALGGARLLRALLLRPDLPTQAVKEAARDALQELLLALVERCGDANARVHVAAMEALLQLAQHPGVGLQPVAQPLLRPPKNMGAAKPLLGRLAVLEALAAAHGQQLSGDAAMPLLGKCLESASGDVRAAALKLCAVLAGTGSARPDALMRMLPKTLKPAMREAVAEALGAPAPAPPSRGAVTALPPNTGSLPRAKAAPPKAAPPPSGKPKAKPPPPPPASASSRAVAALTSELRLKERELGLAHPQVAVLLTDLAALHSEDEAFAAAQPLYERALRIQEQALGAEHPDCVQTLTDLAICHLDQGANEKGRPLLERALALQEAALGPEHADVAAVRDVLASLDAEAGEQALYEAAAELEEE